MEFNFKSNSAYSYMRYGRYQRKYKGKEYPYIVTNIFEQEKKGYINLDIKDESQLFLTTCSKAPHKQLIIETKKIVLTP